MAELSIEVVQIRPHDFIDLVSKLKYLLQDFPFFPARCIGLDIDASIEAEAVKEKWPCSYREQYDEMK